MGFEERDVENGVETREVGRETKLVGGVGDGTFKGERAEPTMVELVGRTRSLDVPTEEPDELARLVARAVLNALVVVMGLTLLSELELRAQLVMESSESRGKVGCSRDWGVVGDARVEGRVVGVVGVEGRLPGRLARKVVE